MSNVETPDFDKIIEEHKKMMALSKNLSDFQINNLKSWPLIVFDGVDKCEISYNFFDRDETLCPGNITFNYFFKEGQEPTDEMADKAFENVSSWCKTLFFVQTEITFQNNGQPFRA